MQCGDSQLLCTTASFQVVYATSNSYHHVLVNPILQTPLVLPPNVVSVLQFKQRP